MRVRRLVAAFIGEPVMQAHGVQIAPASYLQRVREICDKYGVLWINDEVITGFGRTGNWFAIERAGVVPDIMTFAKAMTAGYAPMGGVITTPAIIDALTAFRHVHTFSGHAGAAAAANAVITIKERDNLIEASRVNGAYFLDALQEVLEPLPIVGQVRGVGMWLAVDFTKDQADARAVRGRHRRGGRQADARLRRDRQRDRHQLRDGPAADHHPLRPRRRRQNRREIHPRNRQRARLPVTTRISAAPGCGRSNCPECVFAGRRRVYVLAPLSAGIPPNKIVPVPCGTPPDIRRRSGPSSGRVAMRIAR